VKKKVLAIYYSQSGQLSEVVDNFTTPLIGEDISVEKINVKLKNDFSFPWTSARFFDTMPESVLGAPIELTSFQLKESKYDLVIFAYQPWFLSPSIPANSILQHPAFKTVLKDTPVVTLIGARNMWLNAQEKVKKALKESGAALVGNIVLIDKNSNLISAVTILHWMMTGRKDKKWGIFPTPGVANVDILNSKVFGTTVSKYLKKGIFEGMQSALIKQKAVEVKSNLMFIEPRAGKLFSIWANVISKKKNRQGWLVVFKYYLLFALFIVAPVVLLINGIFFKPFLGKQIRLKKQYYLALN